MVRLHGVDRARERPQMYGSYLGDFGPDSPRHLLAEVFNSLVDDFFAGQATGITLAVWEHGGIMLRHDGPGFPLDVVDPKSGQPLVEWLTTNSACSYERKRPPPRHKWRPFVPYFLVNAFSTSLIFENRIDGQTWQTEFDHGKLVAPARLTGPSDQDGVTLAFQFDPAIFGAIEIDTDWLLEFAREQSCLYPGLQLELIDERADLHQEFYSEQGVVDLVRDLIAARPDDQRQTLYQEPICFDLIDHAPEDQEIHVQVAFQHTVAACRQMESYANCTHRNSTTDMGWKVAAFCEAFGEIAWGERRRDITFRWPQTNEGFLAITAHVTAVVSSIVSLPAVENPNWYSVYHERIVPLVQQGTLNALQEHPQEAAAIVRQLNAAGS